MNILATILNSETALNVIKTAAAVSLIVML